MSIVDHQAWRRLFRLVRPYFVSDRWRQAWGILALLLLLLTSIKLFDVVLSYVGRDFMTALSLREEDAFMHNLYLYLGAFGVAIPIIAFYRFTEERLALAWRRWLTNEISKRYLQHRAYYRLSWYAGIDNPDQRIEEDIRSFTSQSLSLFLIFLQSAIALFAFMGVLSSISWTLTLTAVGYALIGSAITFYLGRPLIGLNFEQLRRDADFRYKLIKVRDNAESIAFLRGESREQTRVRQRFKRVIDNTTLIIKRNLILNFFTTGYNYLVIILPTVIVAPLYLRREIEFGVVTQSAVAFGHVLNALSVIVTNFGTLSSYAAVIRRLGGFVEALDDVSRNAPIREGGITFEEGSGLTFDNVTILTPDRSRALLSNTSLELSTGGLLICGPSGGGKSAILRVLAGLWTEGQGRIVRPPQEKTFYVPQRPYLVLGSLRNQLLYGQARSGFTDEELMQVLQRVELGEMVRRVGGLSATVDWGVTLSNGEQQRLGIARLLLARPRCAFLDEATTAIDPRGEADLYRQIIELCPLVVSVGFPSTLAAFHTHLLELCGEGRWQLRALERGAHA